MSNVITQLGNGDVVSSGDTVFVKATFNYIPFFNPSTDTYKSVFGAPEYGSNFKLLDVHYDALNNPTFMFSYTAPSDLPVSSLDSIVMNGLQQISANITRLFGIAISQVFETSDNNWPDSSSTLATGQTVGDVTASDIGKQATDTITTIGNDIKAALPSSTTVIIILIILVIGIIAVGYVAHEV